ncbi:hypothetical protein J4Q44_G00066040 [Coregonus suidteri]|uniref:Uncharacterized protein n=1 Tax=Coregonus suidteri TaxID=861788 RepID=A0AAN8MHV4_9TELE
MSRSSNCVGLSATPLSAFNNPEPVRRSRIPDLPLDTSLLFEFLLFLYLLVALFVQYINVHRTVWCCSRRAVWMQRHQRTENR